MDCTIHIAKTKALISFAVSAKLICVFVFAHSKRWFSHDAILILKSVKSIKHLIINFQREFLSGGKIFFVSIKILICPIRTWKHFENLSADKSFYGQKYI